jgi:hypothetical protein
MWAVPASCVCCCSAALSQQQQPQSLAAASWHQKIRRHLLAVAACERGPAKLLPLPILRTGVPAKAHRATGLAGLVENVLPSISFRILELHAAGWLRPKCDCRTPCARRGCCVPPRMTTTIHWSVPRGSAATTSFGVNSTCHQVVVSLCVTRRHTSRVSNGRSCSSFVPPCCAHLASACEADTVLILR